MSSDINRVNLTGRITRDYEQRVTKGGTEVYQTGLAFNDRRKGADGSWTDVPNFIELTFFGARGKALGERGYLQKGMKCAVEGKLRYSSWEQDGQRRSKLELVVEDFVALQGAEPKPQSKVESSAIADEDIPF